MPFFDSKLSKNEASNFFQNNDTTLTFEIGLKSSLYLNNHAIFFNFKRILIFDVNESKIKN